MYLEFFTVIMFALSSLFVYLHCSMFNFHYYLIQHTYDTQSITCTRKSFEHVGVGYMARSQGIARIADVLPHSRLSYSH